MSDSHPNIGVDESRLIRGAHGVMAEPDDMSMRQVLVVGAIALVIFLVGGIWAWWILQRYDRQYTEGGAVETTATITQYEVGIVNQRHFNLDDHAVDKIAAQQKALNGYGYKDRQNGRVHVPIAEGMKAVIQDAKNRPAVQPTTPAPPVQEGIQGVAPQGVDAKNQPPGQGGPVLVDPQAPGTTGQVNPGAPDTKNPPTR